MSIVQNILFPRTSITPEALLYFSEQTTVSYTGNTQKLAFREQEILCLNTYFNSFYAYRYRQYTNIENLYYTLVLEGDFCISVHSEDVSGNQATLLKSNFMNCAKSIATRINLPKLSTLDPTIRIFFKIKAISDNSSLYSGCLVTDDIKTKETFLGVIICTFKKENFVMQNVRNIISNDDLKKRCLKLFIIDNGQTLKPDIFSDDRVKLIPNRNVGGSGGFTRGLLEAIDENATSHFLFMDDDIDMQSESITRLISFLDFAKEDLAISGSLLDIKNRHMLYESGAKYRGKTKSNGNIFKNNFSLSCQAINKNLDLSIKDELKTLLKETSVDYGGFWFFSFSRDIVQSIGYPLPVFKTIDDIEFGIRINEVARKKIITLPGIGVWHRTFTEKGHPLDIYFYLRNHLIVHAIYLNTCYEKIIILTSVYTLARLLENWNTSTFYFCISGLIDFYEGPLFLKHNKPEAIIEKAHIQRKTIEEKSTFNRILLFVFYMLKWILIAVSKRRRWYTVCDRWKDASKEFSSYEFWKEYLKAN